MREERVAALTFDANKDALDLELVGALPAAFSGATRAQLLLDAAGFLVGVDVGAEPLRTVAMLGRHEDVNRTVEVTVQIVAGRVRISDAARLVRAREANPYLPRER